MFLIVHCANIRSKFRMGWVFGKKNFEFQFTILFCHGFCAKNTRQNDAENFYSERIASVPGEV